MRKLLIKQGRVVNKGEIRIDDQVHFREPRLTYKGDIFSESKAAVAGGITLFMDMPNSPGGYQSSVAREYG